MNKYNYQEAKTRLGAKTKAMKLTAAGAAATVAFTAGVMTPIAITHASGGSSSGSTTTSSPQTKVDTIKVTKAYTNATANGGGEMLIKAASSDTSATLTAYRPDGTVIGQVQNGGGSRYGGTVMAIQAYDPGSITVVSSSGGSVTVPTTPFLI